MIASGTLSALLTIRLLGPMQVQVNGHALPQMRSRKALWLLALLTLRAGLSVDREWLAGTLWPDADQGSAAANLRVILSELRRALGSEGARLQTTGRRTLLLDISGANVDVVEFDAAMIRQDSEALKLAVELYRGPLLEDCDEEWVMPERVAREQECHRALQTLADTALAIGDYHTAVDYYRRAISLNPLREAAQRGLMQALFQGGDGTAALEVYRAFVRLLRKDDPRAAPDEKTTALYADLRAERRRIASGAAPIAAGDASTPAFTGYLPHPLTDLVGREDERLEAAGHLRRSRLVTLTGPGGIGKTRLAIAVAHEAASDFPGGVWFVALDALSTGAQALAQIAGMLSVKEEAGRTLQDNLADRLRDRRLLLVLDNCEHLLDACAGIASHLLGECFGLRILATSREALSIAEETVWAVPALSVPNPAHLPSAPSTLVRVLMGFESAQLFVERAQSVNKTFTLSGDNALAVARICAHMEGIPLALELAAARIRSLTVKQIAERLDDHLALLTGGNTAAESRQRTLRATLDWSYSLLTPPEQYLLACVSVFSGGWTLEAAQGVCSDIDAPADQTPELLQSLVDKSLVVFEQNGQAEVGRYRLLEMVRQYAASQLAGRGQERLVQTRHRDWFLKLAEEANLYVLEAAELTKWLRRLDMDYDNLRAALAWCEGEAQGALAGLRMAGALWRYWSERNLFSEGRAFISRALAADGAQGETSERGWAIKGAGVLAVRQGDYTLAREIYSQAHDIFRALGNRHETGSALGNLNDIALRQGDYASARMYYLEARAHYEQSLAISREQGNKERIAHQLTDLGVLAHNQGLAAANQEHHEEKQAYYEESRARYEESLIVYRELGNQYGIAVCFNCLAVLAHRQGDYSVARTNYLQSFDIFQKLDYKPGTGMHLSSLGTLASYQGDYASARAYYEQSLGVFRELGDTWWTAYCLNKLIGVTRWQKDYESARTFQEEEILLRKELGDRRALADGLERMGGILLEQDEAGKAVRLWGASHSLREHSDAPLLAAEQETLDQGLSQARSSLGEDRFAAAWQEGRAMTTEQAIDCALS